MTTIQIVRDAIRAYPSRPYLDRNTVKANRRAYITARAALGERWILARRVARKIHEKRDALVVAVTFAGAGPLLLVDAIKKVAEVLA